MWWDLNFSIDLLSTMESELGSFHSTTPLQIMVMTIGPSKVGTYW